ncbi:MAG: ArdC-like ssDNA-binding domain-containing protein [Acidimicrobiales bacterium]
MSAKLHHREVIAQLAEGIANLATSDEWRRYLEFQSRFHRYSFNNVLLIAAQCHEATQVAGFKSWRKLNRFVRTGEKAIWILAPMVYRRDGGADGEAEREIRGFKFVPVFDVSQTEGQELPSVCSRLVGDDPAGHFARLATVAQSLGFVVEDHGFHGTLNGDCSHAERRIRIEIGNSPVQRVKTLAHELAHALLHEDCDNRALAELEAESTAYVVCRALGIDSGVYSFGYVATWAGGGEEAVAAVRASCGHIQRAAAAILGSPQLGAVARAA